MYIKLIDFSEIFSYICLSFPSLNEGRLWQVTM